MPQIKHVVLVRFPPRTARETIAEIFESLDDLQGKIPGILDISAGPYESPDGLNQGFTHAFIVTFADVDSRDVYLDHPAHVPVEQMIMDALSGNLEDLLAFDFKVDDRFRY